MANRDDSQNFQTTGRRLDGNWMDSGHIRPTWRGKESRNTVDSGIESMENRFASLPLQPGGRKRHADDGTLRRVYADIPKGTSNASWNGPHKRILFESVDPESTFSGSETQETRPGWPPDDVCANLTRYKGSFDDRDCEGLRLLSPLFQKKVLKLQRDLEEAKAESRYFRARQVDSPVIATNRPRFTSTPVPRFDGVSDWDQYREVFEAIVCSNGWDEMTAALQLLAHLDCEALNVALLVPEGQRRRPGVLSETLSAHYTSPGRLGEDPAAFAIALETLARRAFVDVDAAVRLQLVRDKFIAGQKQRALRRHLDCAGPDTPISSFVDKCRVWESHEEINSRPRADCEPGNSRGVFQVREQVSDDHSERTAEPDSNSSDFENLADRLREMVQQPVLEGSGSIRHWTLRQLLPIDAGIGETGQPTSEAETVGDQVSGNVA